MNLDDETKELFQKLILYFVDSGRRDFLDSLEMSDDIKVMIDGEELMSPVVELMTEPQTLYQSHWCEAYNQYGDVYTGEKDNKPVEL